jgi:hypothetical protein
MTQPNNCFIHSKHNEPTEPQNSDLWVSAELYIEPEYGYKANGTYYARHVTRCGHGIIGRLRNSANKKTKK